MTAKEKTFTSIIPPSARRSGAVSNKKEENPFCYKSLPKKRAFFFQPLDKTLILTDDI
jgi:hypothetical protein